MKTAIQTFIELGVPFDGDITIKDIIGIQDDARTEPLALLAEARQLLVTAANAGEYGTGPEWAKRYSTWQEAVRVLGVK